MTFLSTLGEKKQQIIQDLERIEQEVRGSYPSIGEFSASVVPQILDLSKRGKMVRGGLLLFLAKEVTPEVLRLASVLEIINTGILIHDDVIDGDRKRRGVPSVWANYEQEFGGTKANKYGTNLAICVGDIAFFIAFELLNNTKDASVSKQEITRIINHEMALVGFAEMQDVDLAMHEAIPSSEIIEALYRYKTARYTFSLPFQLAALINNESQENLQKWVSLGETIGILFQIHDDYLGIFGDPNKTGKPIGSDLREGKKTLYISLLKGKLTGEESQKFTSLFGKQDITQNEISWILQQIEKHGIGTEVDLQCKQLALRAKDQLEELPLQPETKETINALVTFIQTRQQ